MLRSRFAPSPTGLLHIGNARSAILNWAYIKNNGGEFILRIDDTDKERSKKEYEDFIKRDLLWLGINWDKTFNQSDRQNVYDEKIQELKNKKRIYPCFETQEELSLKKKSQLTSGKPPIYDRNSLKLSDKDINELLRSGKKPHWRFRLNDCKIQWNDLIKGDVSFESKNLSDPVLIREDGSLLYHLPSVIDDIEEGITNIIRGEDHITNTAFHIQIFESLDSKIPSFGHHTFLTDNEGKGFGKRLGSVSIQKMKEDGFENITIANYLLSIGTSVNLTKETSMDMLIKNFQINNLSSSSPKFSIDVLRLLNKDILQKYNYLDIKNKFNDLNINDVDENFWIFIKNNIEFFHESLEWRNIVFSTSSYNHDNSDFLKEAFLLIPDEPYNINTWDEWTSLIKNKTGLKGKELFMPLRKALTGKDKGPELKYLLPLLTKENISKKFNIIT
jgi:glutamyl-tRNA synthetase